MVTIQQIKDGVLKYIDDEFISRKAGLEKWMIAFAVEIKANEMEAKLIQNKEMLLSSKIMQPDGLIDVDKAYRALCSIVDRLGPATNHLPIFGDVTFNKDDITKIYHMIIG